MVEVIKKAIEKEMAVFAEELQDELTRKYVTEFTDKMNAHRNKVVLDAMTRLKIESERDTYTGNLNIMIRI